MNRQDILFPFGRGIKDAVRYALCAWNDAQTSDHFLKVITFPAPYVCSGRAPMVKSVLQCTFHRGRHDRERFFKGAAG